MGYSESTNIVQRALSEIEAFVEKAGDYSQLHRIDEVNVDGKQLPIYAVTMGNRDPQAPVFAMFGGVHGVERIGSEVVLAYMHTLIEGMSWMPMMKSVLQDIRLVFMPLVNPGGVYSRNRCNPNGVDLMRNAPIDAEADVPFLLGGQRLSRMLPWYRGVAGGEMEVEARALIHVVERYLFPSRFSLSLDCHSGYGHVDHVWFPYAYSRKPFRYAAEVSYLADLFHTTYPNHTYYKIEPQSFHYMTHGDLWDWLSLQYEQYTGVFLPMTLEMGSWLWIKKNPRQLFRFTNLFNPVLPHRHRRILRRHLTLFNFLLQVVHASKNWSHSDELRASWRAQAEQRWYAKCDG